MHQSLLIFILLVSFVLLMVSCQEIISKPPMEVVALPQSVGEEMKLSGEQAVDVPRPKRFILGALLQGLAHSANRNHGGYYGKNKIKVN